MSAKDYIEPEMKSSEKKYFQFKNTNCALKNFLTGLFFSCSKLSISDSNQLILRKSIKN